MSFKHAYIAPTEYLLYAVPKQSDFHLLLAHLLTDKDYVAFYKEKKRRGDFIIVDNGAFEFHEPLQADELSKLIGDSKLDPNIIVAPDYPFQDWKKTVKSTEEFSKTYQQYFPNSKLMAVPQSIKGDWKGWLNAYKELGQIENVDMIGMSIIGIPNAWCNVTGTEDIAFNRLYATTYMLKNDLVNWDLWHHYLGLGGNVKELLLQNNLGVMNSNDSSSAIWHGIHGIQYDDSPTGLKDGKIKIPVDFNLLLQHNNSNWAIDNFEIIQSNVNLIEEYSKR